MYSIFLLLNRSSSLLSSTRTVLLSDTLPIFDYPDEIYPEVYSDLSFSFQFLSTSINQIHKSQKSGTTKTIIKNLSKTKCFLQPMQREPTPSFRKKIRCYVYSKIIIHMSYFFTEEITIVKTKQRYDELISKNCPKLILYTTVSGGRHFFQLVIRICM